MKKLYLNIFLFFSCILLSACSAYGAPVDISEPADTGGTVFQPTDASTSVLPAETEPPFFKTEVPFERPTDEPVKTGENSVTSIPAFSLAPTESLSTPGIPETTEAPTPIPAYMKDYGEWMDWRVSHPEEYNEWKLTNVPEKISRRSIEYTEIPEAPITELSDRYIDVMFDSSFPYEKFGSSYKIWDEYISTPLSMPRIFFIIDKLGIAKEELLEYLKWQNWSDAFENTDLSKEDIDVLYSGDKKLIRDHFRAGDGYTYLFGDLLFTSPELSLYVDPFDIGRMFTPDSFAEFAGPVLTEEEKEHWAESRAKYELVKKRDAGELTMETAEELIGGFMYLYKNLRYSPDDFAGEPMSNYVVDYPWGEDKCVFKDFACVERLQFSFLDFDIVGRYNYVLAGQIFNLFDWFDEFQYVISTDPGFYCGEIKPFDDGYTLADHINIVYTDNEDAYAELTARKRDGSGEAVYTVNFKKSYERWRISSGTMLDLILRVDYG